MRTMGNREGVDSRVPRTGVFNFKPYTFTKCHPGAGVGSSQPRSLGVGPKPRSGHRVVCNDVNLYSYGGYNPNIPPDDPVMRSSVDWNNYRPLFREVWKLNFASRIWTKLNCAEVPDVLASNAVILAGNVLMVFGGTGVPFGAHCSNDLFVCDLSKHDGLTFTFVSTLGDIPTPKYGQAIMVKDEHLFTVGGTTGYEYSCDIHRLDLKTKIWEHIFQSKGNGCEEPHGRYRHELAFDDSHKIFILGGGTAEIAYGFEEIDVYNLLTNKWEKVPTLKDRQHGYPSDRRCHSCVQFRETDGRLFVYIIGGYNKNVICKDVWRLELNTSQWTKLKNPYPMPVYFHSSAITPMGKVYTFGGIVKDDPPFSVTSRTSNVYSMWVTIPKLKEICWEALLYFNPNLRMLSKSVLFDSGIPHEYIERFDFNR